MDHKEIIREEEGESFSSPLWNNQTGYSFEEEENFSSPLLNNQTGYLLAVADAFVGHNFEMHNVDGNNNNYVAQVNEEPPRQVNEEPPMQVNVEPPRQVNEEPPMQVNVEPPRQVNEEPPMQVNVEPPRQVAPQPAEKPFRIRKTIPPHVLRDIAVHDPKRARRIIANRRSATRAKDKKRLHINVLEKDVLNLQDKWNSTSTQLAMVQNERQELVDESIRLKDQTTMVLERIRLQDELNEQVRNEVGYLKISGNYCELNDYDDTALPDDETPPL